MSGYYASNPHYAAPDHSEQNERQAAAEAEASHWFNDLTRPQLARFNERMAAAAAYKGAPRWDRERTNANREFAATTQDASRVAEMVLADMLAAGEVSEATNEAFARVANAPLADAAE